MSHYQVLYESANFLILSKEIRTHYDEILTRSDTDKCIPVHRLDFETSGALLFTKQELVKEVRALFTKERSVRKIYLAGASQALALKKSAWQSVKGSVGSRYRGSKKVHFFFDAPPKRASSWHSMQPVEHAVRASTAQIAKNIFQGKLYEIELITGARHQIRSYFAAMDAPILGDPVYGEKNSSSPRLELHAWKLEFQSPFDDKEKISVEAPLSE